MINEQNSLQEIYCVVASAGRRTGMVRSMKAPGPFQRS